MHPLTNLSDEALVAHIRSRDKQAYAQIIHRYQAKLLRYATYLTNDSAQAADVVQDSFIKAYINLNGFNTKKKFSSWIYRIVHNQAINSFRQHPKHQDITDHLDIDSGTNIEDDYILSELKAKAELCLSQMTLIYKEPLSLYFLEDKSYQEISDILHLPMGTVATRINRAKAIMQKLCQKQA